MCVREREKEQGRKNKERDRGKGREKVNLEGRPIAEEKVDGLMQAGRILLYRSQR